MYKTFKEAETAYFKLWSGGQEDKEKAIEIAQYSYDNFEENHHEIILDLIYFYGMTDKVEECKEMLESGFSKRFWYPKGYLSKFFEQEVYKDQYESWCKLRDEEVEKAKCVYETFLPENFNSDKYYPLFISLHGWGEDLVLFNEFWQSEKLKNNFIHVSIQSSQIFGSRRYEWTDMDKTREDIYTVIDQVKSNYLTDDTLIIGGFSQGATTAMVLAMEKSRFFNGFVALNPSKHDLMTLESIKSASRDGLTGGIITGDQDNDYKSQLDLMDSFKKESLKCELIVNKDFGHWFPDNLSEKIDQVIDFINQ